MSTLRILERLQADMPCTAENPNENSYERGKFDGVMAYRKLIDEAHYDVRSGGHASDIVRECRDKVMAALGRSVIEEPNVVIDREWQHLLDKDDRTSPEEHPDMILVTHDEFEAAMRAMTLALTGKDGSAAS